MQDPLATAPLLSTPSDHLFQNEESLQVKDTSKERRSDEQIYIIYEIERTLREIRRGRWTRIALQFPDEMLQDAPKVFDFLRDGLKASRSTANPNRQRVPYSRLTPDTEISGTIVENEIEARPYILADTSYGACCVDEIASEHIGADVVVHYGRSCLSPTARLPVIYVFTEQSLDIDLVVDAFEDTYADRGTNIILMADIPYSSHLKRIHEALKSRGYTNVFVTDVVYNPSSALPNRTVPPGVEADAGQLMEWELFHIADPPEALLLTLSSRVSRIHIYPTSTQPPTKPLLVSTTRALSRRYALLTSVSNIPIFGILINTLSVMNYLPIVQHVKAQILAAGKKSYTFVVGKINPAKVANFSEIGAWVVIGCWESSLVESKDFWKPVIIPFELELALRRDEERVWTGRWSSDFQEILNAAERKGSGLGGSGDRIGISHDQEDDQGATEKASDYDSDDESTPPEFDLRTGRLVSQSKPMQPSLNAANRKMSGKGVEGALTRRAKGDLAFIGGSVSPGAEFLRSKRTWKGLGSDFEIAYEDPDHGSGAAIEEGRRGVAKGYVHSDSLAKT